MFKILSTIFRSSLAGMFIFHRIISYIITIPGKFSKFDKNKYSNLNIALWIYMLLYKSQLTGCIVFFLFNISKLVNICYIYFQGHILYFQCNSWTLISTFLCLQSGQLYFTFDYIHLNNLADTICPQLYSQHVQLHKLPFHRLPTFI